jgi:hypothetical protein
MNHACKVARTGWALCFAVALALGAANAAWAQSSGQSDPAFMKADAGFDNALSNSDSKALAALLDANFTWTDMNGKSQTAAEVAHALPKPIFGGNNLTRVEHLIYGDVGITQLHNGRLHILRMWVKRPAGWRALVYHEVQLRDTPPPAAAAPAAGAECINPCRAIPYQGKTANERAVATSFSALETSVMAHDAERWASMIGEEFEAASSAADKLLDKKTRKAELAQASMAGLVPTPLVSAHMTELGDAIIMESVHQPPGGKPMHATRLWVKRGAGWVETVSYQTTIQAAPAAKR